MIDINSAYKPYFESLKRFNALWGGAGSGKSHAIAQKKIIKLETNKYAKELIFRKNYVSHKNSTYALFQKVIADMDLISDFNFRVSPLSITCKRNKNELVFLGLNDEKDREKLKSIVDPTGAWLEETNEFDREDLSAVNIRIRGKNNTLKQIDISFNPVDEDHWLKRYLETTDDLFVLNTNYKHNEKFLDVEYTKALEALINEDENLYNIYCLGKWGSIDVRGLIYKKYDDAKNVCDYKYDRERPIYVVCDFNVDPMKWALIQNVNGNDYIFDEIVKQDTDTEQMCIEILNKYGKTTYEFYGDYSGTFRHTSSKSTDYDIIKQYFPDAKIYVKPNPPVVDRINAVNWRLCNKDFKRRLFVTPNCVNVRADFKRAKFKEGTREEDKNLEKYDGRNPIQSLIHISSAIGYYIEYKYSLKGKALIDIWRGI